MTLSKCLCSNGKKVEYKQYISFKNEKVFTPYEGITICKCSECGVLKSFRKIKNPMLNPMERYNYIEAHKNRFKKLFNSIISEISKYYKTGYVLDVGCGNGILTNMLIKKGYSAVGIEPDLSIYKKTYKRLKKNIFYGTLKDFLAHTEKKFDVVIYNHVLEHIEDVNKELTLAYSCLREKGIIVVGLPNTNNIIFKLRKKYWEFLLPSEHIWHFNTEQIKNVLFRNKFCAVKVVYSNDKRYDYPPLKRIYFIFLCFLNSILHTGEMQLVIAEKI